MARLGARDELLTVARLSRSDWRATCFMAAFGASDVPVSATANPDPRPSKRRRPHEGMQLRHSRRCRSLAGGACSCTPSYQAQVWSPRDGKPIRKTFATLGEARAWRQESQVALRTGTLRAPSQTTLQEAAEDWLAAAAAGVIRTRSGDAYKPSALRAYQQALRHRVLPALGQKRLTGISTNMLQDLADGLAGAGLAPSSIRNTILPLRAIYRRAHTRGEVALNPTLKLSLPAVRGQRERVARPDEATALLAALPLTDRAIWATALYAGLRLGELQALDWNHIDLDNNLIHIERSWDRSAGFIQPKSRSGTRHTYAAYMIAAGINTKALSTYMGHASITITLDRYGHLLPGNEHQAATLLDGWLRANAEHGR